MRNDLHCTDPRLALGQTERVAGRKSASHTKAERDVVPAFCEQTALLGRASSLNGYALHITAENARTVPGTAGEPLPLGVIGVTYPDAFLVGHVIDAMSVRQTATKLRLLARMANTMSGRYPSASEMPRILRLIDGLFVDLMLAHVDAAKRAAI